MCYHWLRREFSWCSFRGASGAQGECLSAVVSLPASPRSFDSVRASLRSASHSARMTGVGAALVGVLVLSACRQDMHDQPRFKPLAKSDFYADQR